MSVFKMKESKFGAPAGIYAGRFLGVSPFKGDGTPRIGQDGKPMEPGIEWQWEITDGECKGQIVGRITSAVPTTKNACGTLLSGLLGRTIQPDEEVDPDPCRGQSYQVVIGPSKTNPDRTQVIQVVRMKATPNGAPSVASVPLPASAPPAPPAPPTGPGPSPVATDAAQKFWVQLGDKVVEMARVDIADMLQGQGAPLPVALPVMRNDQVGGWRTAKDFGIGVIPF